MILMGVTHPGGNNNAACLLIDGQLAGYAEEERFTRQKHAPEAAPFNAIKWLMIKHNLRREDVEATAVGFESPPLSDLGADDFRARVERRASPEQIRLVSHLMNDLRIRWVGKSVLRENHHLAHAASALIPSGMGSANVISLDGYGGDAAGLLGWWEGGDIHEFYRIPNERSWGVLFHLITDRLGFGGHGGEGKTMGLASYGEPDEALLPDFCDGDYYLPNFMKYSAFVKDNMPSRGGNPLDKTHMNIAATLQHYYNRSLISMGRAVSEASGLGKFVMCGGVALNCTGNGALAQQDFVEDLWVQPASHDGGTALGAAILTHRRMTGRWPECKFPHAYWGPSFSEDECRSALEYSGLPYERVDPAEEAARALVADEIVGFFQGGSEAGPRALGNRSILANPTRMETNRRVNRDIKKRELWRPLAPSVLAEHYTDVFDARIRSEFMIMAFQAREEWKERVPAIVHVDGSARPQSVSREANPVYHAAISAFHRETGIPLVLNTSFNLNDEPMVNAPDHAIATFARSGMDTLILGPYAVRKRDFRR